MTTPQPPAALHSPEPASAVCGAVTTQAQLEAVDTADISPQRAEPMPALALLAAASPAAPAAPALLPRPRGPTPRVRLPDGSRSATLCVWDGMCWIVPPGVEGVAPTPTRPRPPRTPTAPPLSPTVHTAPVASTTAPASLWATLSTLGATWQPDAPAATDGTSGEPPAVRHVRQRADDAGAATRPLDRSAYGEFTDHPKAARLAAVMQLADDLELTGTLAEATPQWAGRPDHFEAELSAAFQARARQRVARSTEPESLAYALGWYRIMRAAFPHRIPFLPLTGGAGDVAASLHNEETIMMLGELMRMYGSVKAGQRGRTLAAKTIGAVQSTIRAFRAREAGHQLQLPQVQVRNVRLLKDMRREDGPTEQRARREGFRAQHFTAAALGGLDRTSPYGRLRWGVLHFCHNCVARGASAGATRRSDPWDPARGLVCAYVTPLGAASTGTGMPGFTILVFPGKDCRREHVKRPIPVSARTSSPSPDDPLDAYVAIAAEYDRMLAEISPDRRSHTPFFRRIGVACAACAVHPANGAVHTCHLVTADVASMFADARQAAGLPRDGHEQAHEGRIGGATDIYEVHGYDGRHILERRGRWGKDIAYIYARVSATRLFQASADMSSAVGTALEDLVPSWTQGTQRS